MVPVFLASYPTRNDLGILTDMATLIRAYHDNVISLCEFSVLLWTVEMN